MATKTGKDPLPSGFNKAAHGKPVLFPTTFKSIRATVIGAKDLKGVSKNPKWSPICKVQMGEQSLISVPIAGGDGELAINTVFTFPFTGEPCMRFELVDVKSRLVGFHDFNITNITPSKPTALTNVEIGNRKGVSGRIAFHVELDPEPLKKAGVTTITTKELKAKLPPDYERLTWAQVKAASKMNSVRIICLEGQDMVDPGKGLDKMDPYIKAFVGSQELKSEVFKDAGKHCEFNTAFTFPYDDEKECRIEVMDRERTKSDKLVGKASVDLKGIKEAAMRKGAYEMWIDLVTGSGKPCGKLRVNTTFLNEKREPLVERLAATDRKIKSSDSLSSHGLSTTVLEHPYKSVKLYLFSGRDLYDPEWLDKMDPYTKVRVGNVEQSGEVLKDAGTNPNFYTVYTFPYKNQRRIRFLVFDRERVGKDRQVGYAKLCLEPPLAHGKSSVDARVRLQGPKNKDGGFVEARLVFGKNSESQASVAKFDPTSLPVFSPTDLEGASSTTNRSGVQYLTLSAAAKEYKGIRVGLIDGRELYDVQWTGKMDPYCRVRVGENESKTEVMRDAGVNPQFNTSFTFPYAGESTISFTLKDRERAWKNRAVGTAKMSLEHILKDPTKAHSQRINVADPKGKPGGNLSVSIQLIKSCAEPTIDFLCDALSDASSHGMGKVSVKHEFKSVKLHLFSAYDLYDPQFLGKMDPYCKLKVGNTEVKGGVKRDAGRHPKFHETYQLPYAGEKSMKFTLYDREHVGRDRQVGFAKIDLTNPLLLGVTERCTALAGPKGEVEGRILYRIEFVKDVVPGGTVGELMSTPLTITDKDLDSDEMIGDDKKVTECGDYKTVKVSVLQGRQLYDVQWSGKQDPYVKAKVGEQELKTDVQRDAGRDADFNTAMYFPWKGERTVCFEVRDREHVGKNRLIGNVKLDLEPTLHSRTKQSQKLELRNSKGQAGTLNTEVEFMKETIPEARAQFIVPTADSSVSSQGLGKSTKKNEYKSLRVTVGRLDELYNPQWVGKMDPYVKASVGQTEVQSEVMRDAGTSAVINTCFHFPYKNERSLKLSVWDREHLRRNREVGRVKINLDQFLDRPESLYETRVALTGPKAKAGGHMTYRVEFMKDSVDKVSVFAAGAFEVKERTVGDEGTGAAAGASQYRTLKLSLFHGRELYSPQSIGKMDPYAKVTLGEHELQSAVCKDQGKNPDFETLFVLPWVLNDRYLRIELKDREHTKRDQGVGELTLDLQKYLPAPGPHEIKAPVTAAKKGREGGFLEMELEFIKEPCGQASVGKLAEASAIMMSALAATDTDGASSAGKTKVTVSTPPQFKTVSIFVTKATDLYDPETFGKMDPFVKVRHGTKWMESEVMKSGGPNPSIQTMFMFPYENYRRVKFEFCDKQTKGSRVVGTGKIDLMPLLSQPLGKIPMTLSLRNPKDKQQGTVELMVEFLDRESAATCYKQL